MIKKRKSAIGLIIFTIILIINLTVLGARNDKLTAELDQKETVLQQTQVELANAIENFEREYELNGILRAECTRLESTLDDFKSAKYELVYIGDYKLTHYCVEQYSHICGTGTGLTATGTQVTAGKTVAVDPTIIPYGTKMYIEDYGWRVAEDCGGAVKGSHIDIAVDSHDDALSMGTKIGGVWILVNK